MNLINFPSNVYPYFNLTGYSFLMYLHFRLDCFLCIYYAVFTKSNRLAALSTYLGPGSNSWLQQGSNLNCSDVRPAHASLTQFWNNFDKYSRSRKKIPP